MLIVVFFVLLLLLVSRRIRISVIVIIRESHKKQRKQLHYYVDEKQIKENRTTAARRSVRLVCIALTVILSAVAVWIKRIPPLILSLTVTLRIIGSSAVIRAVRCLSLSVIA